MNTTVEGIYFRMKILYSYEGNWSTKGPKVMTSTSPRGTGAGGKSDTASGSGKVANPVAREDMRGISYRLSSLKQSGLVVTIGQQR